MSKKTLGQPPPLATLFFHLGAIRNAGRCDCGSRRAFLLL